MESLQKIPKTNTLKTAKLFYDTFAVQLFVLCSLGDWAGRELRDNPDKGSDQQTW